MEKELKMNKNKEQLYSQCLLRKRSGNVSVLDVSWIPVEFSVVGKCLKFWKDNKSKDDKINEYRHKDIKDNWDDGWIVVKVYGTRSEDDIVKMNWDYRKWSEVIELD